MDEPTSRNSNLRRARQLVPPLLLLIVLLPVLRIATKATIEPADFTFNNGTEVQGLDPATVTGIPEGRVMRALYEGLYIKHPRTLEPLPGMAESYELSEDRLTYTFHIRKGAKWTNDDPVTAHDFEYSWERFLHPETAAEYAYQLWYVRGAKQYTLLPSDYYYVPGELGAWVRDMKNGRVRVGVNGYALGAGGSEGEVEVDVRASVGAELAQASPLLSRPGKSYTLPIAGELTALNEELETNLELLLNDPYENGWVAELAVEPAALAAALEAGELQNGPSYRKETIWPSEVGIRATDDQTLVIDLNSPTAFFLQLCAFYPLFPINPRSLEEAKKRWPETYTLEWLQPGYIVTNGPFKLKDRRVNDRLRLEKNEDYWDADNVAFNTIDVLTVENYATMLNLYLTGGVDWIDRISTNQVPRLLPREDYNPIPYFGSYFYRVNVTKPPYDDPRVRRALALTIDRRAICEKIMKSGQKPSFSLVPPGMHGYESGASTMKHSPFEADYSDYEEAFARDVAEAHELIKAAGFGEGGEPFPTFEIHYNTSEAHRDIAEVVADSWKRNLGLDARLLNQEWKVYLDTQQNLGYDVSRSAWIGDYLDPNTFLDMFVTGNENNKTGWGNPEYDALVASAATEFDPTKRMQMLSQAESILMEELPILPIYMYTTQTMYNPRIGGFYDNILDEHFPKHWYWMSDEELAERRSKQPADWEQVPAPGPKEGLHAPAHVPGAWD